MTAITQQEITIASDAPGASLFILGNEAIARGAIEAGVSVAAAYPGTPSTEILETLASAAKDTGMYVEWSTNEKVAFEVSYAASLCGLRGLSSMKQLGVNVALDSLKGAVYKGVRGGLVLVAADEPLITGMQDLQDTRFLAQRGYIPVLEPSSPQEAKDMVKHAFQLSEEFGVPYILRSVTRISHARSDVVLGEISKEKRQPTFLKEHFPIGLAVKEVKMFTRFARIKEAVNRLPYNRLQLVKGAKLGVICSGLAYAYTEEALRDLGLEDRVARLKIGTTWPLPEELVKAMLTSVEEVLIAEELESFVELNVKAIAGGAGIAVKIHGKDLLPIGELSTRLLTQAIAGLTGVKTPVDYAGLDKLREEVAPLLPVRPPAMCAGCPHRASQYAIQLAARRVSAATGSQIAPIFPGDIGCYNLASFPPLSAVDERTVVAMGSSYGVGNGLAHISGAPVVAHLGDSTFFHAGIPPLINAVFNNARFTMVVFDNRATAMTGFQPHPGTGTNAMGLKVPEIKPEDIARAVGVKFVEVVQPFDGLDHAVDTIERAMKFDGPSFVVFRGACAQLTARERRRTGEKVVPYRVDQDKCSKCLVESSRDRTFPCVAACPAGNAIKGCLDLIKQGKLPEALALFRKTNPLPSTLGRVCYHPCEADCNRGRFDQPVAIHELERFLGDLAEAFPPRPAPARTERVAIIGSGPAGLSGAYHLAGMGYRVTVFEALPLAGGMLAMGIPEYRLPRAVLNREIQNIKNAGVEIKVNSKIESVESLFRQGFDAVFVAVGAWQSLKLGIEGEAGRGVMDGAAFLKDVALGKKVDAGGSVAIIGGGNVAIDSARVARRLGAQKVSIVYRRTRAEMPANSEEIEAALEEGIEMVFLAAPLRINRHDGRLELVCQRMEPGEPDAGGRRRPVPVEGSEFSLDCDLVIPAIGQTPDLSFLGKDVSVSAHGTVVADPRTMATTRAGVFAGGDAVTGPATVTAAVGAGRRAAAAIDRYIRKLPFEIPDQPKRVICFEDLDLAFVPPAKRAEGGKLPAEQRLDGFAEVNEGLSEKMSLAEAQRCLACGVGSEKCITRFGCPAITVEDDLTVIDSLLCDGCGICALVCPHQAIVQESAK